MCQSQWICKRWKCQQIADNTRNNYFPAVHRQHSLTKHTDYSSLLHNSSLICSAAQQTHNAGQQHRAHHTAGTQQAQDLLSSGAVRQHSHTTTDNDSIIPSLQHLRQASHIHRKVQQRYQDLEQASTSGTSGNFELLLEALNEKQKKNEKIKVPWPQDLAFVRSMRKRPTYEQ